MIVSLLIAAGLAYYFGQLIAAVRPAGRWAAGDRLRLLTTTLEAALLLLILRIVMPWGPATAWIWVALVGALFAIAAIAGQRAAALPWRPQQGRLRQLRAVTSPLYAVLLVVLCGLLTSTLV